MDSIAEDILTFWFGTADLSRDIPKNDLWFKSTPEFDNHLIDKFQRVHEKAAAGDLNHLRETPEECVALVISLDQFPRNIYRGNKKAFHTDHEACKISHFALDRSYDAGLSSQPCKFLYLPLQHSEKLSDQDLSVEKYQGLDDGKSMRAAVGHRDAIRRFGRFPHRNSVLGRKNTPDEEEYLKIPPTWGMTKAEAEERERMIAAMDNSEIT
ncbi:MAG: hypothetical protein CFH41_00703 [Alphaproteobacteria bacterium MarineAlpha11_Bin1]|nr:MAG: hypothetical protein CFH41_00703 [Alphaproteobacteria bacterium MarineAlpha11_Bin1]|tara:strand:- start:3840 stop:4472 length:633 start_codon:yes stop_codon:yes gene_type:complete